MPDRTSNSAQRPTARGATHVIGTTRVRPITKLRTIDELADLWDVSPRTVQRLIKSGVLRAHRIGRLVRISDADATDYLDENRDV